MKALSGKIILAALAIVAVIALLGLHACATGSRQESAAHKKFKITQPITCAHPGPDGYCPLTKSQADFDAALIGLENGHRGIHGHHYIKFLCKDGESAVKPYNPHGHGAANNHPKCNRIKTVKVTKSEAANRAAADTSAANDPNAVYHLVSDFQTDIDAVQACFQ